MPWTRAIAFRSSLLPLAFAWSVTGTGSVLAQGGDPFDFTKPDDPPPSPIDPIGNDGIELPLIAGGRVASLTLKDEDERPLVFSDGADHLAVGEQGTLSFWARPEWDDTHCEELREKFGPSWPIEKYVYSNASVPLSRFQVALSCDRKKILLESGGVPVSAWLTSDLEDGQAHHFVLHTSADGTTVFVDGREVAVAPVSYEDVKRVPLFIGSNATGEGRFLGTIAALRVWEGLVDVDVLESLKDQPVSAFLKERHGEKLVGYLSGTADSGMSFTLREASTDVTGTWMLEDTWKVAQDRVGDGTSFAMQAKPVLTLEWTTRCSELAALVDWQPTDPPIWFPEVAEAVRRIAPHHQPAWKKIVKLVRLHHLANAPPRMLMRTLSRAAAVLPADMHHLLEGDMKALLAFVTRHQLDPLDFLEGPQRERFDRVVARTRSQLEAGGDRQTLARRLHRELEALFLRARLPLAWLRKNMATPAQALELAGLDTMATSSPATAMSDLPGDPTCAETVLAVIRSTLGEPTTVRLYRRTSERAFQSLDGRSVMKLHEDGSLSIDGRHHSRPRADLQPATYEEAWGGGGGLPNMHFNSRSWDLRTMDLVGLTPGTDRHPVPWIFALTSGDVGRAWRRNDRHRGALPWGLGMEVAPRCGGGKVYEEVISDHAYAQSLERNVSATIANFTVNEKFNSVRKSSRSEKSAVTRAEARCERYSLYLEPARSPLTDAFRRAVERLRRDALAPCPQRFEGLCEPALKTFVDEVGTHFANVVTYGGRAVMESRVDADTYSLMTSAARGVGFSVESSLNTTVSTPGQLASVSTELKFGASGDSYRAEDVEQLTSFVSENMKWQSYGGQGGSSWESWSVDDNSVVPVFVDLELVSHLLAPPHFTDAETISVVRHGLEQYLERRVLWGKEALYRKQWFVPRDIPLHVEPTPPEVYTAEAKPSPDTMVCSQSLGKTVRGDHEWGMGSSFLHLDADSHHGNCRIPATGETITWKIFPDGYRPATEVTSFWLGRGGAERVCGRLSGRDERGQEVIGPAPCAKWLGLGITDAGRHVLVSAGGGHSQTRHSDALHFADSKRACVAGDASADGDCRFGYSGVVKPGSLRTTIQTNRSTYLSCQRLGSREARRRGVSFELRCDAEEPTKKNGAFAIGEFSLVYLNEKWGWSEPDEDGPHEIALFHRIGNWFGHGWVAVKEGRLELCKKTLGEADRFLLSRDSEGYWTLQASDGRLVRARGDGKLDLVRRRAIPEGDLSHTFVLRPWDTW
ncbi:MAG: MAC/perforin domain-containing protein [Acidobacteriota bacterium]